MNDNDLSAIAHELRFWKEFVKTERFLYGWVSNIKTPELNSVVYDFLVSIKPESVLDIGSGACSILKGTVKNVVATDPLGGLYECIFNYKGHGLKPPLSVSGENLAAIYAPKSFDVCHISNALDHCQDPVKVLTNMVKIAKKYVIVQGFVNEADFEKHDGFHQHNIDLVGGKLVINGIEFKSGYKVIKSEKMKLNSGKEWIIWIVKI